MIPCPFSHQEPGKLPANWQIDRKLSKRSEFLLSHVILTCLCGQSSAIGVSWENTIVLIDMVDGIETVRSQQNKFYCSYYLSSSVRELIYLLKKTLKDASGSVLGGDAGLPR